MPEILIIEDEMLTARKLEMLLVNLDPQIKVLHIFDGVADTLAFFQNGGKADLIFLDIHLSDGSGFSLFEKIEIDIPVIFVTAYEEYALAAFKQNSVDYILKPFSEEDLKRSLDKFKKLYTQTTNIDYLKLAALVQQKRPDFQQRFLVQAGKKMLTISVDEIAYFYTADKLVYLVTKSNRKYIVNYSMDKLMTLLDDSLFYRLNRKLILHIAAFRSITQKGKGKWQVALEPPTDFEAFVPMDKTGKFKNWLNQ